jgi:hypothetical protein
MPKAALPQVPLCHINSHIDTSVAHGAQRALAPRSSPIVGYTEWGARWAAAEAYVSWNWAHVSGGIVVLDPAAIRTNIVLVDEGDTLSMLLNKAHIYESIEVLPWRAVIEELLARAR